jgi:hypothetical protein
MRAGRPIALSMRLLLQTQRRWKRSRGRGSVRLEAEYLQACCRVLADHPSKLLLQCFLVRERVRLVVEVVDGSSEEGSLGRRVSPRA